MKRTKVALDVCTPKRLVGMLQSGFGDQGFEFIYETQFAPATAEDQFWATAFRRFGGEIVITGDKNIAKRPHQIIAFKDNDLICFFCEGRWSEMPQAYKAAHLIYWWPRIQEKIRKSVPRDCWWIPLMIKPDPFTKVEIPTHIEAKARAARNRP